MRFAALALNYYTDPAIEAIGEDYPEVFALWPWLICQCHDVSHADSNPEGVRAMTRRRAARHLMNAKCADIDLWNLLVESGLIEVEGDLNSRFVVRLNSYQKHQQPFGSSAQRMRAYRLRRAQNKNPDFAGSVTPALRKSDGEVTNKDKDKDKEEEITNVILSQSVPDSHLDVNKKNKRAQDTRKVFDYWVQTTGRNNAVKLDAKRRGKIQARLAEGYTVEQLCRAVYGFSRDPFHSGDNPRGKKYLDIPTLLRDGPKVDEGLDLADQYGGKGAALSPTESDALIAQAQELARQMQGGPR